MKVLLGMFAVMLFAGVSTCRADSFVAVNMLPTTFDLSGMDHGFGNETIGVTFLWDTTTNVLSDFQITAVGHWGAGLEEAIPQYFIGSQGQNSVISFMTFSSASTGAAWQMNSGNHGGAIPQLPAVPGKYFTDLFFQTDSAVSGQDFTEGTAIVSAVPAAEPATGLLVGLGLAVAGLMRRRKKKLVNPTVWENLG